LNVNEEEGIAFTDSTCHLSKYESSQISTSTLKMRTLLWREKNDENNDVSSQAEGGFRDHYNKWHAVKRDDTMHYRK
jgi:hypothetical protein